MRAVPFALFLTLGCVDPERFVSEPPFRVDETPVIEDGAAPPAISGGTLLISRDGRTAFVSDPDHDVVWSVDLDGRRVQAATALQPGDEPGRLAQDARGLVHVALRRGGAIATFEPGFSQDVTRRSVCAEPRGIAYDERADALHVACTGGELITMPAAAGPATRTLHLDQDLRDVVVEENGLRVSRFRSSEVITLGADGTESGRGSPSTGPSLFGDGQIFSPGVAWRTVAVPGGGVLVAHQRGQDGTVSIQEGGYGGDERMGLGIVESGISYVGDYGAGSTLVPQSGGLFVLPVDVAVSADGARFAAVAAGSNTAFVANGPQDPGASFYEGTTWLSLPAGATEPMAVGFAGDEVVIQTREPAALHFFGTGSTALRTITLSDVPMRHSGHQTFHRQSEGAPLACASCHPEGREDGRVWDFEAIGPRRTQNISGGIVGTEPFHWGGELTGFSHLVDEVFVSRMGAIPPSPDRIASLSRYIDSIPAPIAPQAADNGAVARGQELFNAAGVNCTACHSGEKLTNNATMDVGTGGPVQVPSLVGVWDRSPLLHDGCADSLEQRFGPCGGDDRHGTTSHLDEGEIGDLVAYLRTL